MLVEYTYYYYLWCGNVQPTLQLTCNYITWREEEEEEEWEDDEWAYERKNW